MIKDAHKEFLAKKSEKIVKAIYLISEHIDVREPLRWTLREKSLVFLNNLTSGEEIINLLQIAEFGRLVSPMNVVHLVREIRLVMDESQGHLSEAILGENFFVVAQPELGKEKDMSLRTIKDKSPLSSLHTPHNIMIKSTGLADFRRQLGERTNTVSARREKIVSLARKLPVFSIRDISQEIPDLSEKTIQRELLDMVREGVLKKEGERRWSRYTLVS